MLRKRVLTVGRQDQRPTFSPGDVSVHLGPCKYAPVPVKLFQDMGSH
jgi:hypothetical protein